MPPSSMMVVSQPAKRCRKCGLTKPVDLFPRNRQSSDGHRARCKPCHADDVRQWTHAKPERLERVRKRVVEWKQQHPEMHHANERRRRSERWRDDPVFRQACRERWLRYRQKNVERRAAAYRKWVRDNPERARARNRRWAARIERRRVLKPRLGAWRTQPEHRRFGAPADPGGEHASRAPPARRREPSCRLDGTISAADAGFVEERPTASITSSPSPGVGAIGHQTCALPA